MTRRSRIWFAAAVLFTLINLGGMFPAAAEGELFHAGAHVALFFVGLYFVWRLAPWRARTAFDINDSAVTADLAGDQNDRLAHLEQAVDAVAIEVERIGEGQRFMTRLFTEKGTPEAPAEGNGPKT